MVFRVGSVLVCERLDWSLSSFLFVSGRVLAVAYLAGELRIATGMAHGELRMETTGLIDLSYDSYMILRNNHCHSPHYTLTGCRFIIFPVP